MKKASDKIKLCSTVNGEGAVVWSFFKVNLFGKI